MGPLISQQAWQRVKSYIDEGIEEGASLVIDGRDYQVPGCEDGFFMGPSLFDHVTQDMKVYQDEVFGPLLCIVRTPDFATACELIDSNPYGNGTAIYTQNGAAAREFVTNIQVGMVGVNVPIPVPMSFFSFGGWKQSFFGDTHAHGPESIRFYTKLKNVTARWPHQESSETSLHMPTME